METRGISPTIAISTRFAGAESPPLRLLLTIPEAAASLGVSRSLVYELIHIGTIATIRIGRSRRVPVTALHDFISRQLEQQDN